jgi:predicted DNA-binding protein with PD1-like motif
LHNNKAKVDDKQFLAFLVKRNGGVMKHFSCGNSGKIFTIELSRGEKVVESIEEALKKEGIRNAYIATAIGSLQKVVWHRPTIASEVTEDEYVTMEGAFEIGGISGTIMDGVPHLHFSAANAAGVYVGHLEYGTECLYLLEVTIVELLGYDLERKQVPSGVKCLFSKGDK